MVKMLHKVEVRGEVGGGGCTACGQKVIRAPQRVSQAQGHFICAPLPVEIRQHNCSAPKQCAVNVMLCCHSGYLCRCV